MYQKFQIHYHVDAQTPVSVQDDRLRVDWEYIGEGYCGDYNPADPQDSELLRFVVFIREDDDWTEVEDGSYCTMVPYDDPHKVSKLIHIFQRYREVIDQYPCTSLKKLGEELSWTA